MIVDPNGAAQPMATSVDVAAAQDEVGADRPR
jgi:hypothetical protein